MQRVVRQMHSCHRMYVRRKRAESSCSGHTERMHETPWMMGFVIFHVERNSVICEQFCDEKAVEYSQTYQTHRTSIGRRSSTKSGL